MGPRGGRFAQWGRAGPVRAEWGWGGVGHALGIKKKNSKTRLGARIRSSGAAWGQFGASGA